MKLPALALAILTISSPLHARSWMTADNKPFEADYVGANATHVSVRVRDGRVVPVELIRLSAADREFVAQQVAAKPAAATPSAATPAAPKPLGAATPAAVKKSPYSDYLANEWKQFEGKGNLKGMFFVASTTGAPNKDRKSVV